MTDEVKVDPLADKEITLKFTVKDLNAIINLLNFPSQAPVVALANVIGAIQMQCAPQIDKLNEELANEPETAA